MAASEHGQRINQERRILLSRLISQLLRTAPGEDDHELALEFCVHHTDFHTFLDTNPRQVEEQYTGCVVGLCHCLDLL